MSAIMLGNTGPKIPEKARGIRIRHRTKRGGIALLPIYHKPLLGDSVYPCPNCQVIHTDSFGNPMKTVHLWLDSNGGAIVSEGVLADIKRAGHLGFAVDIVADIVDPPPITLTCNRSEVDQDNAKIHYWKEPVIV